MLNSSALLVRDEMNDIYNICDLMFLPSYNELFPMSILEALALKIPVLLRNLDLYHAILFDYYFATVSLPLSWRALLSGAIMMWARAISEFGSIVIITYNPKVASILIYDRFTSYGLTYALPVAVLLVLICLFCFALLRGVSVAFHLLVQFVLCCPLQPGRPPRREHARFQAWRRSVLWHRPWRNGPPGTGSAMRHRWESPG